MLKSKQFGPTLLQILVQTSQGESCSFPAEKSLKCLYSETNGVSREGYERLRDIWHSQNNSYCDACVPDDIWLDFADYIFLDRCILLHFAGEKNGGIKKFSDLFKVRNLGWGWGWLWST